MEVFRTDRISENDFALILSILNSGGVIGFPTDTAYGLGADPFDESAVDRIFQIKGRAEAKPILLLVNGFSMAESVSQPSALFDTLAQQFWPGPLTLVVRAPDWVPAKVTAGTKTIGLRWPAAEFPNSLLARFGRPITATSANRSGMAAAITADEVCATLGQSVDAVVDGGTLPVRGGSSVLDLTSDQPVLLREGPISFERLRDVLGGAVRRPLE
jgi:L-threonylcarbamoyladenylate synthase